TAYQGAPLIASYDVAFMRTLGLAPNCASVTPGPVSNPLIRTYRASGWLVFVFRQAHDRRFGVGNDKICHFRHQNSDLEFGPTRTTTATAGAGAGAGAGAVEGKAVAT